MVATHLYQNPRYWACRDRFKLLKGLCKMARIFGITMIAEGVQTEAELALLPQLGFDAATGPAVSK